MNHPTATERKGEKRTYDERERERAQSKVIFERVPFIQYDFSRVVIVDCLCVTGIMRVLYQLED